MIIPLYRVWNVWAAMVAFALSIGNLDLVRQAWMWAVVGTLAVLESLGIQYGPRVF